MPRALDGSDTKKQTESLLTLSKGFMLRTICWGVCECMGNSPNLGQESNRMKPFLDMHSEFHQNCGCLRCRVDQTHQGLQFTVPPGSPRRPWGENYPQIFTCWEGIGCTTSAQKRSIVQKLVIGTYRRWETQIYNDMIYTYIL